MALKSTGLLLILPWVLGCQTESPEASTGRGRGLNPYIAYRDLDSSLYTIDGDASRDEGLFGVVGALTLKDGAVLVADEGGLKVFDRAGKLAYRAGTKGNGPGEYGGILWIRKCGEDSIFVADWTRADISVLASDGSFVRRFVPQAPTRDQPARFSTCSRGGKLVGWRRDRSGRLPESGPYQARMVVYTLDVRGEPTTFLGTFDGPERYRYPRSDGPRPLGHDFHVAVSDSLIVLGTSDKPGLAILSPSGDSLGHFGWDATPQTVSAVDRKKLIDDDIESARQASVDRNQLAERRRIWRTVEFPDTYPAFSHLFIDQNDRLWIRDYPAVGTDQVVWRVFDRWLKPEFYTRLPVATRVLDALADTVLVAMADELGVETVRAILMSN